ncbi:MULTISPECIES: superoxide dismutase [unclassified Streptomyces]|uniref:superoxide dismutase n=1 Tax=unclassified Streptomyces TaxID=2593676 RepID=UPI00278C1F37|nr:MULTISPECIES: superoxide dismutase [unclassified Streptomyces]
MHRSFARRRFLAAGAAGAVAVTGLAGGTAHAADSRAAGAGWPRRFFLPDGFQPEGIAIGAAPYAYFGSLAGGDVYRASFATGRGTLLSTGLGAAHPTAGLKINDYGRLYLAGATSREIRIASARDGRIERTYVVGSEGTMVNDVVLTPGTAWFTDSYKAQLYGVALGRRGEPGKQWTLPLKGDWEQGPDFTANGIERTPDGRALIVVNTVAGGGSLMRVDPRTGVARALDLGGATVPNGDGLLLIGRLLYVVQQWQNVVDVFRIDAAGTRGAAVARITDPLFRIPTTAAAWDGRLYLPNARFDVEVPTPDTEYDVIAVDQV